MGRRLIVVGVVALVVYGAGSSSRTGEEAYLTALEARAGQREAEVVTAAGPATAQTTQIHPGCGRSGGVRELVYEVRRRRAGGLLGTTTELAAAVCLDRAGVVLSTRFTKF